jgi:hypothetical protein
MGTSGKSEHFMKFTQRELLLGEPKNLNRWLRNACD